MKVILSIVTLLFTLVSLIPVDVYATDTGYFIVTAYYSPLPDQEYYIMGNYEAEVRMNGRWTNGASGAPVFSWMLAAPGKYGFGTKIYLEWLGIGDVQDRWGAIVPKGERWFKHDRIDVWMGTWEEGLRRAMYWGKRKVKWQVVSKTKPSTLDYHVIPSPVWASNGLKKSPQIAGFFSQPLWVGSNKKSVQQLQEFFTEIGKYNWKIDGIYNDEIIDIVFDFQVENKLISYNYEYGAGYWGAKTRKLFLKKYLSGAFKNTTVKEKDVYTEVFDGPANTIERVNTLQEILTKLDLYNGEIDGDYSSISDAIFEFQVINELIDSNNHPAAGWFGPKTRETIKQKYEEYLAEEKALEEKLERQKLLQDEAKQEATKILENIGEVKFGEVSPRVRELQIHLNTLGYFNHKDTAIFWKITSNSILKFQLDHDLVQSANDIGAGNYWPKTRAKLLESLSNYLYESKLEPEEIVVSEETEISYFTA